MIWWIAPIAGLGVIGLCRFGYRIERFSELSWRAAFVALLFGGVAAADSLNRQSFSGLLSFVGWVLVGLALGAAWEATRLLKLHRRRQARLALADIGDHKPRDD
ncbi:hypothetical protein [Brevundimonas sp. NIBR10]|uniref:hypothetical protein n=1 Tax=Brevundimonas sp. NIBR10 TaxID=3015997 RepID=UPI0022F1A4B8|nr:hypothetical protein [Brevundimonas sp. NIBR10]